MASPLIAILGPTATGKSALALDLAERHGGEIINCDSTAVFRGFDIGTDKITPADRRGIPHHLIDIADPTDEYTAAQFARDAAQVVRDVHARGRLPILAGGTGFYFRPLTRGLFPGRCRNPATRALIAQENRRYARRQLIWFRKEPNLVWFEGPGESSSTIAGVTSLIDQRLSAHA